MRRATLIQESLRLGREENARLKAKVEAAEGRFTKLKQQLAQQAGGAQMQEERRLLEVQLCMNASNSLYTAPCRLCHEPHFSCAVQRCTLSVDCAGLPAHGAS